MSHADLLRASSLAHNDPVDLAALTDPTRDPLVPAGVEILTFVDANATGDAVSRLRTRRALLEAVGPAGLVDAAATFAVFEMMNRVADGTGIPVGRGRLARSKELLALAGLEVPPHLAAPA